MGGGNPFGAGFNPFGGQGGFKSYSYSTGGGPNIEFDMSGFDDPFNLFEQIFGGQGFGGFKRQPTYQLELTFDEAVHGTEKVVEIERADGQTTKKERLNIKVPAGVDDGVKMRFGEVDIVFRVKRSSEFLREGTDIFSDATLTIPEIVLGTTITVKTVEGKVNVKVPAGAEPGTLIRIRGKGVASLRGGEKGSHYVRVRLEVPKTVSAEEKKLYEQLATLKNSKKKKWF
jgi:DnaJ-class molecular chaperone